MAEHTSPAKRKLSALHCQLLIAIILLCSVMGCRGNHNAVKEQEEIGDLQQIKDSGELVVLTLYSSTSYFIYRGQDMGFQYELSEQFAKSLGVKLTIKVAGSVHDLIEKLLAGEGDLIAYNLPITKEWKDSLIYCGEEVITHQVIVQRAGGRTKPLKDVTELIGKDVYVKPGKYYERLVNLDKELGGGIHIHKISNDSITIEDLIMQVSQGKIPYTVADNDVSPSQHHLLSQPEYRTVHQFRPTGFVGRTQRLSALAEAADKWHEENMTSPAYTASMSGILKSAKPSALSYPDLCREGKISHFDHLFKNTHPTSIGIGVCWHRWPIRNPTSILPPFRGRVQKD